MYISGKDKNRSFTQEMANRKRHCQMMVDQFDGPFLDCQLYPLPNCKIDRVYTFLDGLDDRLDKTRRDVLQLKPFPTVEHAYVFVRKEDVRATVVTCDPSLFLIPQVESPHDPGTSGKAFHISIHNNDDDWILNSGATDHMTFDSNDFSNATQPRRSYVTNANGVTYPVTRAGTVTLSPSLSLSNTLLVPSLSNRLMSMSQVLWILIVW
ncbi:hypothetical protein AAG906_019469 [Vitis piasezkii]